MGGAGLGVVAVESSARPPAKVGIIEAGAFADLIVVDGNPLENVGLFHDEGAHLSAIMKEGAFYKNRLQATESDHPSVREMEMA